MDIDWGFSTDNDLTDKYCSHKTFIKYTFHVKLWLVLHYFYFLFIYLFLNGLKPLPGYDKLLNDFLYKPQKSLTCTNSCILICAVAFRKGLEKKERFFKEIKMKSLT